MLAMITFGSIFLGVAVVLESELFFGGAEFVFISHTLYAFGFLFVALGLMTGINEILYRLPSKEKLQETDK